MTLEVELKKGVSKTGNEYYYLFIEDLDKKVFLSALEVKLLKILYEDLD